MLIPLDINGIRNSATTLLLDRGGIMKRKPRAYSREKRKEQIIGQFNIWHMNGDTEPKTMARIAKALDMVPAQTVTDMLLELESEGKLTTQWRDQSGRWTTRFYAINPAFINYHEKYGKRRIVVKHRGAEVGQMELAL